MTRGQRLAPSTAAPLLALLALGGCEIALDDPLPSSRSDAGRRDARATATSSDARATSADATTASGDGGAMTPPRADPCDNGLDDDRNGTVDDLCSCTPGTTQRCFVGDPGLAGRGQCAWGTQRCEGTGEIGRWGACAGAGAPAASESCSDSVDNDCDGQVNEGCACTAGERRACYLGPTGTSGVGACRDGEQVCVVDGSGRAAFGPCTGSVAPGAELCDGLDNNCDGRADEPCECPMGRTRECYAGPAGSANVGICRAGLQRCVPGIVEGSRWSVACEGQVLPGAERCDGQDNNCNGVTDDGCDCAPGASRACYSGPAGTQGVGVCRGGSQSCEVGVTAGSAWGPCRGEVGPAPAEVCNDRVDNNCNGQVDCLDPACRTAPGCVEVCNDGRDNDGDGQVDCQDLDCERNPACDCANGGMWRVDGLWYSCAGAGAASFVGGSFSPADVGGPVWNRSGSFTARCPGNYQFCIASRSLGTGSCALPERCVTVSTTYPMQTVTLPLFAGWSDPGACGQLARSRGVETCARFEGTTTTGRPVRNDALGCFARLAGPWGCGGGTGSGGGGGSW